MNNSTLYNELIEELKENAISFYELKEDMEDLNFINIPVINLKIYDRIDFLNVEFGRGNFSIVNTKAIEGIITSSNYYKLMQDSDNWYL